MQPALDFDFATGGTGGYWEPCPCCSNPPTSIEPAANGSGAIVGDPAWYAANPSVPGTFTTPDGSTATLTGSTSSGFTLSFPDGSSDQFDHSTENGDQWLKTPYKDPQGNETDYTYNGDNLLTMGDPGVPSSELTFSPDPTYSDQVGRITEATGNWFTFNYDTNKRLQSIAVSGGGTWTYSDDDTICLTTGCWSQSRSPAAAAMHRGRPPTTTIRPVVSIARRSPTARPRPLFPRKARFWRPG